MASFFPGPQFVDLLFLCQEHRAAHVYYDVINQKTEVEQHLKIRRGDQHFQMLLNGGLQISDDVKTIIRHAGFGGVLESGYHRVDRALVTAFVERWRPETHTFHLPNGEATITLQDIQVLWGLNIDGDVITGTEFPNISFLEELCEECFGLVPPRSVIQGNSINMSWLVTQVMEPLPNRPTAEQVQQRARMLILLFLGGSLFPNTSGSRVSAIFLYHLRDLQRCGSLSWGSAVLAYLYRSLCKATAPGAKEVAGPFMLLEFWAWERFRAFRPMVSIRQLTEHQPLAARWKGPRSNAHKTQHNLAAARQSLSDTTDENFAWTPYDQQLLDRLPRFCTSGFHTWRCETFLIFWEIVEPHSPSRVMRQFGFYQTIPGNLPLTQDEHKRLHKLQRGKGTQKNWSELHTQYIQQWHNRRNFEVDGVIAQSFYASDEYINWYWPRTVVHIVPPIPSGRIGFQDISSQREGLYEGMERLNREQENWDMNRSLPREYMNQVGASNRLNIHDVHFSVDHGAYPGPPHPRVETITQRRRSAGQTLVDEPSSHQSEPDSSIHVHDPSTSYMPDYAGPSSHVHEAPTAYRPNFVEPSMYDFGFQSSFDYGGSPSNPTVSAGEEIPDYRPVELLSMLSAPPLDTSQYGTPSGSQQLFGADIFSQQMSWAPIADMSTQQPRFDDITPIRMDPFSPMDTYSPSHGMQTTEQQAEDEPEQQAEEETSNWNLVDHRARRQIRPRGPCLTSFRPPRRR